MPYEHDIFISYKRGQETNYWIKAHFEPLLAHSVELELGRPPTIYRDDRLTDGGSWPLDLGRALGRSRVLVSLWTKNYFHSAWCTLELSLMLARERDAGYRTETRAEVLVFPSVLHDCEPAPVVLGHVQRRILRDMFNVRMSRDSPKAELLADALAQAAVPIAAGIRQAPRWKAKWPVTAATSFQQQLLAKEVPRQDSIPSFSD